MDSPGCINRRVMKRRKKGKRGRRSYKRSMSRLKRQQSFYSAPKNGLTERGSTRLTDLIEGVHRRTDGGRVEVPKRVYSQKIFQSHSK